MKERPMYRHFKGGLYMVMDFDGEFQDDDQRNDGKPVVTYFRPTEPRRLFHRFRKNFESWVDRNGVLWRRFWEVSHIREADLSEIPVHFFPNVVKAMNDEPAPCGTPLYGAVTQNRKLVTCTECLRREP